MRNFLTLFLFTSLSVSLSAQQALIDRYLTDPLTYTNIVTSANQVNLPRDLDFKPNSNELWVMNRGTANSGGSMVIVKNAGLPGQTSLYKKDTHSSHFMIQASAMAFSPNGEWGAVSEVQNTASASSTFMGPSLWSADPYIFATVFQNNWVNGSPLGSHLDMLHQSPYAMGIASDSAKVYWVMDGHFENIVRYDFVQDHGPGYDDHGAGKIWRYTDVPVTRVPNIPSHMVLDRENGWLYFIDGGNKQIKRLNVNSGAETGNLTVPTTSSEPLASYKKVEGAVVEVVDTWTTQPCGIDYVQGRLIVSDHTNGDIRIYDVSGTPTYMGAIATGQTNIMGVKVGPDGRIWFVNYTGNKVVRIDPLPLAIDAAITAIVLPTTIATTPNFYSTGYNVCSGGIAYPYFTLTNDGTEDLTFVDTYYSIDGAPASANNWAGALAPGASEDVFLDFMPFPSGTHELKVWVAMPNGSADMNPLNNEMQGSFRAIDPVQSLPFNESFTSTTFPPAGWNYVHFNPNNMMTRSTAGGFGNSTGSVKMDHFSGPMDITGQLDHLMLPRIDLSNATPGTTLDFAIAYKQYNTSSAEKLKVKASTDCGDSWTTLYDKSGAVLSTTAAGTAAFTPSAAQWRTDYVDLSAVLGQPDVLFVFETESNYGNNMYLDDIRIGNTVGIEETDAASFQLYPNPASTYVDLALGTTDGKVTVELFDAVGHLVLSHSEFASTGSRFRLDIASLSNGIYTVLVTSGSTRSTKQLVVTAER